MVSWSRETAFERQHKEMNKEGMAKQAGNMSMKNTQTDLARRKRVNVLYKSLHNASKKEIIHSELPLMNQNPYPTSRKPTPEGSSIPVPRPHQQTVISKPSSCMSSPRQERGRTRKSTVTCQKPVECPSSSQTRTIVPDHCQNSIAKPILWLKRKTPDWSNLKLQPQLRDQFSGTNNTHINQVQKRNLFCDLCEVPCFSDFNMKQHLEGRKHKAQVELKDPGVGSHGETENKQWKCDLCDIWCMNENLFELHLKGKKHKTNLELPDPSLANHNITGSKNWKCELCEVWCTSQDLFKLHLQGKKHINSLHRSGLQKKPKLGKIGFG